MHCYIILQNCKISRLLIEKFLRRLDQCPAPLGNFFATPSATPNATSLKWRCCEKIKIYFLPLGWHEIFSGCQNSYCWGELKKYQLRTPSKGFAYPCWANSRTDWKGIKIMRGRIKGMGNRHHSFHYSNRQKAHVWKWRCWLRITQKVGCHKSPLMAVSFLHSPFKELVKFAWFFFVLFYF